VLLRILFLWLVLVVSAGAGTAIPLPRQTLYLSEGIGGGFGLGSVGRKGCQSMSVWQAQGEYAYSPSLSGGMNMKLFGGNVDKQNAIVYQRYSLHSKFHRSAPKYDLYIGPVFGFDNTDLKAIREEIHSIGGVTGDEPNARCAETFGAQGMSLGYEAGMGAVLHRDWGAVVGHTFDVTTSGDTQFAVSLALAFNIWNHWERLRRSLQGSWLVVEWQSNLALASQDPVNSVVFGVTLGF